MYMKSVNTNTSFSEKVAREIKPSPTICLAWIILLALSIDVHMYRFWPNKSNNFWGWTDFLEFDYGFTFFFGDKCKILLLSGLAGISVLFHWLNMFLAPGGLIGKYNTSQLVIITLALMSQYSVLIRADLANQMCCYVLRDFVYWPPFLPLECIVCTRSGAKTLSSKWVNIDKIIHVSHSHCSWLPRQQFYLKSILVWIS